MLRCLQVIAKVGRSSPLVESAWREESATGRTGSLRTLVRAASEIARQTHMAVHRQREVHVIMGWPPEARAFRGRALRPGARVGGSEAMKLWVVETLTMLIVVMASKVWTDIKTLNR